MHFLLTSHVLFIFYFRYQSESAELSQWLSSALDRLEFWSTKSVTVPQELETVRDHLHAFLVRTAIKYPAKIALGPTWDLIDTISTLYLQEFSKEVDTKSSLRASVQSQGNQLLRLKKVDTATLRANLAQVDTQWADLLTRIPVVQEKLHQVWWLGLIALPNFSLGGVCRNEQAHVTMLIVSFLFWSTAADGEAAIPSCNNWANELDVPHGEYHPRGSAEDHGGSGIRGCANVPSEIQGSKKCIQDFWNNKTYH